VPTIEANTGIVTQVNVFTVPEGGAAGADRLSYGSSKIRKHYAGMDFGQSTSQSRWHAGRKLCSE